MLWVTCRLFLLLSYNGARSLRKKQKNIFYYSPIPNPCASDHLNPPHGFYFCVSVLKSLKKKTDGTWTEVANDMHSYVELQIELHYGNHPDSDPVATYLSLQRNRERQFDARNGAWEGGRENFAIFLLPSLNAPRTHLNPSINHSAYREATGYEWLRALTREVSYPVSFLISFIASL